MKVKHFSSNDNDGLCAIVISNKVFGSTNVESVMMDKNWANGELEKYLTPYCADKEPDVPFRRPVPDLLLVTGIQLDTNVLLMLNKFDTQYSNVLYMDNDMQSLWLTMSWMTVKAGPWGEHFTVSELLLKELMSREYIKYEDFVNLSTFAEYIKKWQLDEESTSGVVEIRDLESNPNASDYIRIKKNDVWKRLIHKKYKAGLIFSDDHINALGIVICDENPDLDFTIVLSPSKRIATFIETNNNLSILTDVTKSLDGVTNNGGFIQCPIDSILELDINLNPMDASNIYAENMFG